MKTYDERKPKYRVFKHPIPTIPKTSVIPLALVEVPVSSKKFYLGMLIGGILVEILHQIL